MRVFAKRNEALIAKARSPQEMKIGEAFLLLCFRYRIWPEGEDWL